MLNTRFDKLMFLSLGYVLVQMAFAISPATSPAEPARDPEYQAQIDKVAQASRTTREAYDAEIRKLDLMSQQDRRAKLIIQAALFKIDHKNQDAYAWIIPLAFRDIRITNQEIISALSPVVSPDGSDRSTIQQEYAVLLRGKDIGTYLSFIQHNKSDPPYGIMRFMFERDASKALIGLVGLYSDPVKDLQENRSIAYADHLIMDFLWKKENKMLKDEDKTITQIELEKLVKSSRWYVRLYAVHLIGKLPELADDSTLASLKTDEHAYVRSVANVILKQSSTK